MRAAQDAAAGHEAHPDVGAERDQDEVAQSAPSAVAQFPESGHVRVVVDGDRHAEGRAYDMTNPPSAWNPGRQRRLQRTAIIHCGAHSDSRRRNLSRLAVESGGDGVPHQLNEATCNAVVSAAVQLGHPPLPYRPKGRPPRQSDSHVSGADIGDDRRQVPGLLRRSSLNP